jgi:hypothetical protein
MKNLDADVFVLDQRPNQIDGSCMMRFHTQGDIADAS